MDLFEMYFASVITIVALVLPHGESAEVSLNRTNPPGTLSVCPNTTAVFTCRVTDSSTLVWTSDEYIGQNSPILTFTFASENGSNRAVNDVVAILTQNSDNILESQLRIRASTDSSIRCLPDHANRGKTAELTVYNGSPGTPVNVSAEDRSSDDSCAILLEWDPPTDTPPEDISRYVIRDSINGDHYETNTSTLVTFPLGECTRNLLINITTVDRCEREGPNSANVEFLPSTNPATDTTTPTSTPSTTTTPTNTSSDPDITSKVALGEVIGPAVVAVILVVLAVILVVAVIICCIHKRRRLKDEITREDKKDGVVLSEHMDNNREEAMSSGPPPPPAAVDEEPQSTDEEAANEMRVTADSGVNAGYAAASGPPPPPVEEFEYPELDTKTDGRSIRRRPIGRQHLNNHHHAQLLEQLQYHAAQWRVIGTNLGFTQRELDNIEVLAVHAPRSYYLRELLARWLEWAPGDGRGSKGFPTLEGLKDALRRSDLRATARDLHL